jgi:hypothetical protein
MFVQYVPYLLSLKLYSTSAKASKGGVFNTCIWSTFSPRTNVSCTCLASKLGLSVEPISQGMIH